MLATYTAVDGYSISNTATGAWLMADTAASMVADRTVNSPTKTLTANGSITTAVTNTNSTTLAASGFSGSNYYSMAYDSDLDPGTSGLSLKAWIKHSTISTSSDYIVQRDSASTAQNYGCAMESDGTISCWADDNTTLRVAQSTTTYDDNSWHCVVLIFDGTDVDLYIDGVLSDNATGAALNTLNNGSAVLNVGLNNAGSNEFEGSIAGLEIDIGNQWTAQQIKTKYDLEKVLFNQLELFSIVGDSLQYEIDLSTASVNSLISDSYTESLDGTRSGLTWYRKLSYDCATIPFARSDLPGAVKFLRSTNNVAFTYDERGSLSNSPTSDNPITVYKTSSNEAIQYSNPYYQYSFSVREI